MLDEAANVGAIILTHDKATLIGFAYDRINGGSPMPGLIVITQGTPIGVAIHDLEILIGGGLPSDFESQVRYIPLNW